MPLGAQRTLTEPIIDAGGSFVFTSNVDGHFAKAGFAAASVLEAHGSLSRLQCLDSPKHGLWSPASFVDKIKFDPQTLLATADTVPRCRAARWVARYGTALGQWHILAASCAITAVSLAVPACVWRCRCKAVARPNVLLFQDSQWDGTRTTKQRVRGGLQQTALLLGPLPHENCLPTPLTLDATVSQKKYHDWVQLVTAPGKRIVVLEIGAGTAVPTVRKECERLVLDGHSAGASVSLVRINPDSSMPPGLPGTHMSLPLRACDALCSIASKMGLSPATDS